WFVPRLVPGQHASEHADLGRAADRQRANRADRATSGTQLTPPGLYSAKLGDIFFLMRSPPPALLPILRSQVAGDLLALLYLPPDAEYSLTEAADAIHASLNAVHH